MDDIERRMGHTLRVKRMPIIDIHNPKQVAKCLNDYFDLCDEDNKLPTLSGMALALKVSHSTVRRWLNGVTPIDPDILQIIQEAENVIVAAAEESLMEGKGNPVGKIFVMKNNFEDYSDKTQVVLKTDRRELTQKELIEMAEKLPGFRQRLLTAEDADDGL